MTIFLVGGASGSGKTAIMPELKKILGETVAVYDFDDIGVPEGADKKWRQEATEKWLQRLLNEKKDCCLLGQIVLGEILACPSAKRIDKINFCLLDVSDFERIHRLKNRKNFRSDQHMLNWSSWLRMHHHDPKWMQQVITEEGWKSLNHRSWNTLANWDGKARVRIIDTTQMNLVEVAVKVAEWVKEKSA